MKPLTAELVEALEKLRDKVPKASDVPSYNERLRTYQNIGAYILRNGRLDAIIEALTRARSENADGWRTPKGWKLVPVEPDIYMMQAGYLAFMKAYRDQVYGEAIFDHAYRVAIAKAPAPPPPAPPVEEKG